MIVHNVNTWYASIFMDIERCEWESSRTWVNTILAQLSHQFLT